MLALAVKAGAFLSGNDIIQHIDIRQLKKYNIREHNEASGCEADIWRMCANLDEAKRNHG